MADKKDKPEEVTWDYESQGGSLYKFEEVGQKVTGLLVDYHETNTTIGSGVMNVYSLQTSEGEVAFAATKALHDDLKRFPADGSFIVQVELVDMKDTGKGNPFKVFKVRATPRSEEKLTALGIVVFGSESQTAEEDF